MLKVVKVRWSRLDAQGGQREMVKLSRSEAQAGQMVKMVKVRWSKLRSDSQVQIVKMVKVVKVVMLRWWGWSRIRWPRCSMSDHQGGQGQGQDGKGGRGG